MNTLTAPKSVSKMEKETAILFEDVSIRYRVPRERVSGIKEFAIRWLQRRLRYQDFWALQDVSFQVKRGDIFGVIGRNGAGKSTTLKVMARVLHPARGRVVMRGKVAPLLELGAGFHFELTGRENIFLNGTLLGYSQSAMAQLFDSIVEFAEVGDFIDAPLRTYSTGMVARLGFSVATSIRPEILLVDEVLSVGDSAFQKKCLDRMYTFQEQGTTIVIISHSMVTIETFCDRAMWLNNGRLEAIGNTTEVCHLYINAGNPLPAPAAVEEQQISAPPEMAEMVNLKPTPQALVLPGATADYVVLSEMERVYPAAPGFNVQQGAISFWLRFSSLEDQRSAIIFHSDDSRYVILLNWVELPGTDHLGRGILARAGGNRRVLDTFYGTANFPEVSIALDGENAPPGVNFTMDEWHLVTMAWQGYPRGVVRLYVDDNLMGETAYGRRHNNQYRLLKQVAVGIRPQEWVGELVQREDGTMADIRPQADMAIGDSGKKVVDMRLYRVALSDEDVRQIFAEKGYLRALTF